MREAAKFMLAQFEEIDGVIVIAGDLYIKNQAALDIALAKLREIGYQVDDSRDPESCSRQDGTSIETMEKNGYSMWYAHLKDIRRGKCKSCGQLISTAGIRCHGHKCEKCGAVTYREIVNGSRVRFSFEKKAVSDTEEQSDWRDITMVVHHWDTKNGYIYFYPRLLDGYYCKGQEKLCKYLDDHRDSWQEIRSIKDKRVRFIRVKYSHQQRYGFKGVEAPVIRVSDNSKHFWNHDIVEVWEGKEYDEFFGNFPVPQSLSIYEAWHWAPLSSSPTLHRKLFSSIHQVSDQGYYYQDGRRAFDERMFAEMGKFVRHFTSLDADLWDIKSRRFRLDGPGGIEDVANFCHPRSEVMNRPNVGNILIGLTKKGPLTEREMAAVVDAARDDGQRDILMGIFGKKK